MKPMESDTDESTCRRFVGTMFSSSGERRSLGRQPTKIAVDAVHAAHNA